MPIRSPKARVPTVDQISAGGVVFRNSAGGPEIVIVSVLPNRRWQLPKGIVDPGETNDQAALREVREEAGVDADLVELIDTIEFWYYGDSDGGRVRFHKYVHFYLLEYVSGSVEDHDHEIAEARWVSIPEAIEMLAFKNEQDVVEKASQIRI